MIIILIICIALQVIRGIPELVAVYWAQGLALTVFE